MLKSPKQKWWIFNVEEKTNQKKYERRTISGKKKSELNFHEQRLRKMMQLIRVHKMLEKAEKIHEKLPEN
jgi:hypothetical protein